MHLSKHGNNHETTMTPMDVDTEIAELESSCSSVPLMTSTPKPMLQKGKVNKRFAEEESEPR